MTVNKQISNSDSYPRIARCASNANISNIKNSHLTNFVYNTVHFSQDTFQLFAGLCAVDNIVSVEKTLKTLKAYGQNCTRMGAYKPRTNAYAFQGHGDKCLPYVFELAGKYDIKIIAMEVTHEKQIETIATILEKMGQPTGVMLQTGTRNAQNFELLQAVGKQRLFPVLYKRGYGITLHESLQAAEYIANAGNTNMIFCLRGVKTLLGQPHRNLVDFAHIPVIKRLTHLPVCIDPSHSVGTIACSADGLFDIFHATAQGIIAGANMALVDVHPTPEHAKVDGHQALSLENLPWFLEDIQLVRETYLKRITLAEKYAQPNHTLIEKAWV